MTARDASEICVMTRRYGMRFSRVVAALVAILLAASLSACSSGSNAAPQLREEDPAVGAAKDNSNESGDRHEGPLYTAPAGIDFANYNAEAMNAVGFVIAPAPDIPVDYAAEFGVDAAEYQTKYPELHYFYMRVLNAHNSKKAHLKDISFQVVDRDYVPTTETLMELSKENENLSDSVLDPGEIMYLKMIGGYSDSTDLIVEVTYLDEKRILPVA